MNFNKKTKKKNNNKKEHDETKKIISSKTFDSNEEIRECPMCYWEFPKYLTLENKKEHIENHFV